MRNALYVLSKTDSETHVILDGGCSEMLMSCAIDETVRKAKRKKVIAVEAFAHAWQQIATIRRIRLQWPSIASAGRAIS